MSRPGSALRTYTGGCHCGRVRFEIITDLERASECNCSICRKKGYLHHLVRPERFRLVSGADDLETYQDFTKAHLDGLKNLTSAFKSLYNSMPTDQKKNADQVFQGFGPSNKSPNQG